MPNRWRGSSSWPGGGASSMVRRTIVLVLDSGGIGELPDAGRYGDEGSSTIPHVAAAVGGLRLPNLER